MVFGIAPRFRSELLPPSLVALDLQPGMSVAFPRRQLPSAVPWHRQDRAAAATRKPTEKKIHVLGRIPFILENMWFYHFPKCEANQNLMLYRIPSISRHAGFCLFLIFYLLIFRERRREREKHRFVIPLIYTFLD
uniref:Uncharacterized protein n=1 Tax=Myotis myotis TaxID=51298 RepID=A0A7J7XIV4_MYOMY|nr:hypothetical protein mMyoMyo1_011778 [Myotis myotis]